LAQETDNMKEYSLYATVAKMASEAFREEKGITAAMPVNVDFYSGFLYKMLNIPEDLYTPLFAMARVVGWCAHRIEEVMTGGKIIRPAYKSVVERSSYVPIDQR
ncbi:MAG: citrate synthase, partial [Clostridia bacterium]|nr:citrate synthase [Clostridia bacterium]